MTNPTPERQNHAESVVIYPIGNISSTPEKQNHAESVVIYPIGSTSSTPENKNHAESVVTYRFFQINFFYGRKRRKESSKKASFQVLIRTKIWGL